MSQHTRLKFTLHNGNQVTGVAQGLRGFVCSLEEARSMVVHSMNGHGGPTALLVYPRFDAASNGFARCVRLAHVRQVELEVPHVVGA